jgi:heme-degrading monooxygenase HmoA
MPQIVIIRPVHLLPGKEEEGIRWAKETEDIRRRWGMLWQANLRSCVDPSLRILIQHWESREAYDRWKASEDRAKLMAEAGRVVLSDRTTIYEVL